MPFFLGADEIRGQYFIMTAATQTGGRYCIISSQNKGKCQHRICNCNSNRAVSKKHQTGMQLARRQVEVETRPFNVANVTRNGSPSSTARRCEQALSRLGHSGRCVGGGSSVGIPPRRRRLLQSWAARCLSNFKLPAGRAAALAFLVQPRAKKKQDPSWVHVGQVIYAWARAWWEELMPPSALHSIFELALSDLRSARRPWQVARGPARAAAVASSTWRPGCRRGCSTRRVWATRPPPTCGR